MANLSHKQPRIFLWSWPRSTSTCLEKCLSFVDGVQTWHEPYFVAFNNGDHENNPAPVESGGPIIEFFKKYAEMMDAIRDQPNEFSGCSLMSVDNFTYPWIKSKLEEDEPGKKYIVIKDMVMALHDHLDSLPDVPTRHTFIIRHPYRCMVSLREVFLANSNHEGDPADFDLFPEALFARDSMRLMWKHVQETGRDPNPIIIDAEDLMKYPERILPKYLDVLGIPFRDSYLNWDGSMESMKAWKGALEHVVMGKRTGFFERAFKSSCVLPSSRLALPKREELPADILRVVDNILPGYEEMYEKRIKPE